MRKIAARYGLSTQSISRIAIHQGVDSKALDPNKVLAASKLIARGMPLTHVAEAVGKSRLARGWRQRTLAIRAPSLID